MGGTVRVRGAALGWTAHRRRTDSDPGHHRLDRGRGRNRDRRRLTCRFDELEWEGWASSVTRWRRPPWWLRPSRRVPRPLRRPPSWLPPLRPGDAGESRRSGPPGFKGHFDEEADMSSADRATRDEHSVPRVPFVYYSYTGQTTKVLDAMSRVLADRGCAVNWTHHLQPTPATRSGSRSSRCRSRTVRCSG